MRLRGQVLVPDPMGTAHEFPIQETGSHNRLVEDGIIMHVPGGNGFLTYHTHLNRHGLYFYKQSLLFRPSDSGKQPRGSPYIRFTEIVTRLHSLLTSANKWFPLIGYFGPLYVRLRLEHFTGYGLSVLEFFSVPGEFELRYSADSLIDVSTTSSTALLVQERTQVIAQLVERVAWAFDYDVSEESLSKYFQQRIGTS
jgi:hypothetical protein